MDRFTRRKIQALSKKLASVGLAPEINSVNIQDMRSRIGKVCNLDASYYCRDCDKVHDFNDLTIEQFDFIVYHFSKGLYFDLVFTERFFDGRNEVHAVMSFGK